MAVVLGLRRLAQREGGGWRFRVRWGRRNAGALFMGREQLGMQGKGEDVGGAESAAAAVSMPDTSYRNGIT